MLQLAHVQTSKLVEDLKAYDFSSIITTSRATAELDHATTSTSNPTVAIGTMLENAMDELFVPYSEGVKYIDKETKTLSELFAGSLEKFSKYHVRFAITVPAIGTIGGVVLMAVTDITGARHQNEIDQTSRPPRSTHGYERPFYSR